VSGPRGSGGKGFLPGSAGSRGEEGFVPPGPARPFTLVLLLGAAGAGLVVFAVRQAWAQAIFTPPHPLPAQDISVTGQQLVPLASALALAALACLAAVIATRSVARCAAGVLLAILGAGVAAAVVGGSGTSAVLSVARADAAAGPLGGSTTSGTSPGGAARGIVIAGSTGHVVLATAPWREAVLCGAVAIVLAGLATAWRGQRWPVMSTRFQRGSGGPGGPGEKGFPPGSGGFGGRKGSSPRTSSDMWESLSRDVDPTDQADPADPTRPGVGDGAAPRNLEDQLGGGTPG
jgi:uncharacterized membrane protein (TIGR02234 family)